MLRAASAGAARTVRRANPAPLARAAARRDYGVRTMAADRDDMQFETLVELQQQSVRMHADKPSIGVKTDGVYKYSTFGELDEQVSKCRGALAAMGVTRGDRVAIISRNTLEWPVVGHACWGLGAVLVPMYEQQGVGDWQFILENSGAKVLFTSRTRIQDIIVNAGFEGTLGNLERVLCFDDLANMEAAKAEGGPKYDAAHSYHDALAADSGAAAPDAIAVAPSDLAELIYTSGTTGQPKGVMLSHENFCANVRSIATAQPDEHNISSSDVSLAFLPWAHVYGQTCELHAGMAVGASAGLAEDVTTVAENLGEVKPTLLFSVPTLFKRIYDGLQTKVAQESPLKQALVKNAMAAADARREHMSALEPIPFGLGLKFAVYDKIVLSKIRERFGGNLKKAFAGGAATPVEVMKFMNNIGVQVSEGYGLTETAPVISSQSLDWEDHVYGTVGQTIDGVDVKLMTADADGNYTKEVKAGEGEGELWTKGANVMQGYWRNQEATDEVIVVEADGSRWFRTGDLFSIITDEKMAGSSPPRKAAGSGYLKFTGRIKEQYKLENGKYVVPGPIEEAICLSRYVNQSIVNGSDREYNVALVVPEWELVREWAQANDVGGVTDDTPVSELAANERVQQLIEGEILSQVAAVKRYEQPRRFVLLAEAFSAERGMLTPKMSIKRPIVLKAYADALTSCYDGEDGYKGLV